MMMRKTILLTAACAFTLAACGADNENPATAVAVAPVSSTVTETVARQFPIPFPEGGTVITDTREDGGGQLTIRYSGERHGEIVGFYDNYTDGTGGWNRSEAGQGEVRSVNYMNLQQGWNISVAPPAGERMLITLTAS